MKPATALIQAASLVLRSIGARHSAATRNCGKARLTQNALRPACASQMSEETPPGQTFEPHDRASRSQIRSAQQNR